MSHDKTKAIIGGVLGGLAFFVIVQGALLWFWKKARKSDIQESNENRSPQGAVHLLRPLPNLALILLISSIQILISPFHLQCQDQQMIQTSSTALSMNSTQILCPLAKSVHQMHHEQCTSLWCQMTVVLGKSSKSPKVQVNPVTPLIARPVHPPAIIMDRDIQAGLASELLLIRCNQSFANSCLGSEDLANMELYFSIELLNCLRNYSFVNSGRGVAVIDGFRQLNGSF